MLVAIAGSVTFGFNTYDPDTGENKAPDALPTISVRDEAGATNTSVSTPVAIATGQYYVVVDVSGLDGVAVGKKYTVWATATVTPSGGGGAVTATAVIGQFEVSGVSHGADLCTLIDGKTPQEAFQILSAIVAGLISTANTDNERYKGLDGLTDRVEFTVDTDGNRSAVVYDPP